MIQPGRIVPERCAAAYLQVSLSEYGPLSLNKPTSGTRGATSQIGHFKTSPGGYR